MNDDERTSCAWTLGNGWGRRETFAGENFRWVANDADFFIATLRRLEYRVDLLVEPGPSIARLPCALEIVDVESGETRHTAQLPGRKRVAFALPAGPPRIYRLRVRTPDGGGPIDGRVLNFRVLTVEVRPIMGDVIPPAAGFVLGENWGRQELFAGEYFRWVDNDATIEVASNAVSPLVLDIEGGPNLLPDAKLRVFDEATGAALLETGLTERREFEIVLPAEAGPAKLRLHVDGGGAPNPADPRVLNFRVFDAPSTPQ